MKIEKGIPIPEHSRKAKYAPILKQMRQGDSVVLPCDTHVAHECARQVWGAGNAVCRQTKDGTRIWRK